MDSKNERICIKARLNKDNNFFVLNRHPCRDKQSIAICQEPVSDPCSTNLAKPVQRVLAGQTGIAPGLDNRGEEVLTYREPIEVLNLGIVAKVELDGGCILRDRALFEGATFTFRNPRTKLEEKSHD